MCIDSRGINKITVSANFDAHLHDLHDVLSKLRAEKLYGNLQKYFFAMSRMLFLGYEVSAEIFALI